MKINCVWLWFHLEERAFVAENGPEATCLVDQVAGAVGAVRAGGWIQLRKFVKFIKKDFDLKKTYRRYWRRSGHSRNWTRRPQRERNWCKSQPTPKQGQPTEMKIYLNFKLDLNYQRCWNLQWTWETFWIDWQIWTNWISTGENWWLFIGKLIRSLGTRQWVIKFEHVALIYWYVSSKIPAVSI